MPYPPADAWRKDSWLHGQSRDRRIGPLSCQEAGVVRKRDRGGTELRTGRVWRSSITTDCHLRTARQPPRLGCGQDEGRTYSGPGPGMEVDSVEGVGAGRKCGCEDIVASCSCSYYFSAYYFSFLPLLLTHTYHPLSLPPLLCTFTPSFLCTIKLSSSFAN